MGKNIMKNQYNFQIYRIKKINQQIIHSFQVKFH